MVQVIVTAAVHDVPPEVEIQLARQAFVRSKLLDKIEDDDVEDSEVSNFIQVYVLHRKKSVVTLFCG